MAEEPGAPPASAPGSLAELLDRELAGLGSELVEIEMLVGQARTEAGRHEQKRTQAADRVVSLGPQAPPAELAEANSQLVTLTRRAAVMEAQLDVLAGKQRTLERYRDGLARVREAVGAIPGVAAAAPPGEVAGTADEAGSQLATGAPSPAVGRVVLAAQEDLRRDIARALHDGPAQSLTNIVLQAQIVERLLDRDPEAARAEVRELVSMVQRTLEATKTFIFDVRPMVLDDLGLVPTLRRVARDRSRRSGVPVDFESLGSDRRLPMDLESTVFRVADEAVAGLAQGAPDRLTITLDWADELELVVRAVHPDAVPEEAPRADMPAALREMVDDRRARAAASGAVAQLTPAIRREIGDRAAAAGGRVEYDPDGRRVRVFFPMPAPPSAPAPAPDA
jgi:two-component system sensor histidine kinase DegS